MLDKIAWGIELAKHPFIWVVKSRTWLLPKEMVEQEREIEGGGSK